jgi:hypothetical protein
MLSSEFIELPVTSPTGKLRVCRNFADPANSSYHIAYTPKNSAAIIFRENLSLMCYNVYLEATSGYKRSPCKTDLQKPIVAQPVKKFAVLYVT